MSGERAVVFKQPIESERVVNCENTTRRKRAVLWKQPSWAKRVTCREKTVDQERAATDTKPERGERATRGENTRYRQRVTRSRPKDGPEPSPRRKKTMNHTSNRRRFLQSLSEEVVFLPIVVLPRATDLDRSSAEPDVERVIVNVFSCHLDRALAALIYVSLLRPTRVRFSFEQPARVSGLRAYCETQLLLKQMGEPNEITYPIDLRAFHVDQLCPVTLPISQRLTFEIEPPVDPGELDEDIDDPTYTPEHRLEDDQFLFHPSFGLGLVARIIDNTQADVVFVNGQHRTLRHAGASARPSAPARTPVVLVLGVHQLHARSCER